MLKQDLRDVFTIYVGFAKELEDQSKQLFECVGTARNAIQNFQCDDLQSECSLLRWTQILIHQFICIICEYLYLKIHLTDLIH